MKKVLTYLSILLSVLCGSIFLVSCSKGYEKMCLTVECYKDEKWQEIDISKPTDYYLSSDVYNEESEAYLLYLRVRVNGTSKKVNSLFISRSANNSVMLETDTVQPDEAFKVLVKNIGSVKFTVVPSNGGDDKAISFGLNIYRKLDGISQNENCVPAFVTGGNIELENLTNLIKYEPFDNITGKSATNQTGVNFEIAEVGSLIDNGEKSLIKREFVKYADYSVEDNKVVKDDVDLISLKEVGGKLLLEVSPSYQLTKSNNVIKLKAISVYDENITADVYVYIVENFTPELYLVSYNDDVDLDEDGKIQKQDAIDDEITIYNSSLQLQQNYGLVKVYSYTSKSIYSFISEPGLKLKLYVDGEPFDYNNYQDGANLGITISPVKCKGDKNYGLGLQFAVNSQQTPSKSEYKIRLELDFTAFDFTASDKSPTTVLTKEFTLKIGSLASSFSINDRNYSENVDKTPQYITERKSNNVAKLYSYYNTDVLGLPLDILAVPTNAQNSTVKVGFYQDYTIENGKVKGTPLNNVQLSVAQSIGISPNADGLFELKDNKTVYLKFKDDASITSNYIYMVCSAISTPNKFMGQNVEQKEIYFIAKFDILGAVKDLYVYKNNTDTLNEDTLVDEYLESEKSNVAYIRISSGTGLVDVDLSKVYIKPYNIVSTSKSKVLLSANGTDWSSSELSLDKLARITGTYDTYKLYFKTTSETKGEGFVITSPNGVQKSLTYKFVNVTSSKDKVNVKFDKTYIWQSSKQEDVTVYNKDAKLNFLALQSNTTVKFEASGDGKNYNIKGLTVQSLTESSEAYNNIKKGEQKYYNQPISTFSSRAVVVSNLSSYFFDVRANSSGFTSVVLVEVEFFVKDGEIIKESSKYFLYEIAVYIPATSLNVEVDKNSILYINENYKDVARVKFTVSTNSATKQIYFSSTEVNDSINIDYGENGYNRIFGIQVSRADVVNDEYFNVVGLNNFGTGAGEKTYIGYANNQFTVEAKKSLEDLKKEYGSIYFDFTIYQFGQPTTRTIRKVVYFGDYTKSERIIVDGVDIYNNLYLSLQSEKQKSATILASVSNSNATYKDLGYRVYKLNPITRELTLYTDGNLTVEYENDRFTIKALNENAGGTYQLFLYAKDSYDSNINDYSTKFSVVINVSNGTESNPYLVRNLNDFENIANNLSSHYRLASDINLSALSEEWWNNDRVFTGSLDGAMTVYDAENDIYLQKQYILRELKISSVKGITDAYCASLFTSNTGTIKNVMLDSVKFDLSLTARYAGSNPVNIASLVGVNNGIIENCCVNIISSTVVIGESAGATSYNVGVLVGVNKGTISYDNSATSTNYASMVGCNSSGILNVTVERNDSREGLISNIGGIVGQNSGTISATYKDGSSQALKYLLTGVVNINVKTGVGINLADKPEIVNARVGGAIGLNSASGIIKNVAITGCIKAGDKVDLGGLVGFNEGEIVECANYGLAIEGYALSTYTPTDDTAKTIYTEVGAQANDFLLEQNIGGIVGLNSGKVDNTRVLFIVFENDEVSISAKESYIKGIGNVAGVIGKANNTQLSRSYVENFITNEDNYNIIGTNITNTGKTSKANVAGFIATGTGNSLNIALFKANIDAINCTIYEFGNEVALEYAYFIGNILVDKVQTNDDNSLINHNSAGSNVYIVENIIYFEDENQTKTSQIYGVSDITVSNEKEIAGYKVRWVEDLELINDGYSYLIYKIGEVDVYTLTVKPSEVVINVDEDYFDNGTHTRQEKFEKYNQGLYVQYNGGENSTAVVYLYKGEDNIHRLVTEGDRKGLIERTIIPNVAKGEYTVRIISGVDIAELVSGDNSIKFNKTGKVVLQFTSIYDRTINDTVEIFVENALNENVFSISTNKEMTNISGNQYSMQANSNSLISLGINDVRGNVFDKTKMYMKAEAVYDDENYKNYFSLTANSTVQAGGYAVGNYDFVTNALDVNIDKIQITIKFQIYLDLSSFVLSSGKSLSEVTTGLNTLIAEKSIVVTIYNSAKNIRMSSDISVSSGVSANIQINLETGYIDVSDNGIKIPSLSFAGDTLKTNVTGKDTIYVVLQANNQNSKDLVEYAKNLSADKNSFSIWDLFDTILTYERHSSGYLYTLNLMLKDEYKALDKTGKLDGVWKFKLTAYAENNSRVEGSVNIEFVPQQLDTFRLENYSKLVVKLGSDNASVDAEYVSSESASSLIIPGSSGLIKIYAEKYFAYCENIKISSSVVQIDGQEYFVRFQQMTYNRNKNVYESYAGITAEGTTLSLAKVSYRENGKESYSGVIFVRTILEKIVGTKQIFDITVSATTYDTYGNSIDVTSNLALISQYQPGVYLTVENALKQIKDNEELFMIEQNSNNVNIIAKVYSGDLNILPEYEIAWITDGLTDEQKESLGNPVEHITISEKSVELGRDEAYYITYALRIDDACKYPFKIIFKVTLIEDGNRLTSNIEQVKFYPVPYIISGMNINGVSNGIMEISIGASRTIKLNWNTNIQNSNAINEAIKSTLQEKFLKLLYIQKTNTSGNVENVYFDKLKTVADKSQNFVIEENADGTYRITALNKGSVKVYFDLYYGYVFENGAYSVVFSNVSTSVASQRIHYEFDLYLTVVSTEDMPKPIYTADDLRNMSAGENYILFEDIVLENWTPLTTQIASLDGNGKVITIKSFDIAVNSTVNAGLFAQINDGTIIKNVAINIAEYTNLSIAIKDDNVATADINFGFLAGINNGLIYNCEIISIGKSKSIEIVIGSGYNLVFGGLVGENNGNITNSRVGTEYFEKITCTNTGSVSSVKVNCGTISIKSSGIMAGFVGINGVDSIISACYVANTSIENAQNKGSVTVNKTAGFVADNSGVVAYSYVKGLESSILNTKGRATGVKIYASGAGSVAGFVFVNTGDIHDCYSNIVCESNSAVASGFVYDATSGSIIQCYSASTVLSGNKDTALATELPFVGIGLDKTGAQQLLSNDQMADCYYLIDDQDYDTNYIIPTGAYLPKGVNLENFANPVYLNNFAFVDNGSVEQQLNGVWTYSTAVDKNKSTFNLGVTNLPELTSANTISRSVRYEPKQDGNINIDELHDYPYAVDYDRGSKNNPYIIRSADEYKEIFKNKTQSGYIRFIDEVDFADENDSYIDIPTRSSFVLGDKDENNLTVIDGNGMTIKNVLVNRTESDAGSIGLFSEAYYSIMKGLNIEYVSAQIQGTSTATYSGGFVGNAKDVFFIDIKLTGNAEIRARNIAGGLVGKLTGTRSGIYNITSDLIVKVGYGETGQNYLINDDSKLSYAGGLAGIIDIGKSAEDINISRVTINSSNVTGNKVGGLAGYMGSKVYATRLTYNVSSQSQIFGTEVAGGIVGENYAKISLSQIGMPIDTQYTYDKAFGAYINNDEQKTLDKTSYGNLNAVVGSKIIGGFIGLNYGGEVNDSLTKANIGRIDNYLEPTTVGGFVGKVVKGVFKTCYAQNYIDLTFDSNLKYVGGFIGEIDDVNKLTVDNCVVANWFDKSRLEEIKDLDNKPVIDFIAGKINKSGSGDFGLYYGDYLTDLGLVLENSINKAQTFDMKALYNLDASNQKEIFETLFILWDTNYWDLDNTRFMPNLRHDNATSFIELETPDDLRKFNLYPNSNFILMNDIDVGELNSNYVANIEFTGILIGRIQEDGSYPAFKNITLNASTDRSVTSGFFRSTAKARIANVKFEYTLDKGINLNGNEFANVGGVSAEDTNSRFENVTTSGLIKSSSATVLSVGSITGTGKRSTIVGCNSSVEYNLALSNSQASIGGIVGSIDGSNMGIDMGEEVNTFDALIRNSSYSGIIATKYKEDDSSAYSTIGGIAGTATYTNISGCEVELKDGNDEEIEKNDLEINNNAYLGGIVGFTYPVTVQNSSAYIMPVYATEKEGISLNAGGIIGKVNSNSVSINRSNAKLDVVLKNKVESAVVGGIIAETSGVGSAEEFASTINQSYAELNFENDNDTVITNAIMGGIVGISGSVSISSSTAYLNSAIIDFETSLIGGGIIGEVKGDYSINHSSSVGQLFANSSNTDTTTAIILGGMIGLVGEIGEDVTITPNTTVKGIINGSYTTLTLSTAGIYQGSVEDKTDPTKRISHEVYVSAVVGYSKAEKIETNNVVYSSDYNLAFDNSEDKFTTVPTNYSANILLYVKQLKDVEGNELLNDLFGRDWILKDGYLPVQLELQDLLLKEMVGILKTNDSLEVEYSDLIQGESYNPIQLEQDNINNQINSNKDKYCYYVLFDNVTVAESVELLNGVILGCNFKVEGIKTFVTEISKHSAISNIIYEISIDSTLNGGGIATINDGTVFMSGIEYVNIQFNGQFGGIAQDNNGNVLYCYNSGTAETASGNGAGLVCNNKEFGAIQYSYFIGMLANENLNMSAISYENAGYIANCYSAGAAGNAITATDKEGRYADNFFDYYANFIKLDDYNEEYKNFATGKSTLEMQQSENGYSTLWDNYDWVVYSILNVEFSENVQENTYNYGYPIHNFNQKVLVNGLVTDIPMRAKLTGNGTFKAVASEDDVVGHTVKDKLNNVYDDNSYLLNHFGMIVMISNMESTANRYFELENNIIIPKDFATEKYLVEKDWSGWQGVGSKGEAFAGIFSSIYPLEKDKTYYELDEEFSTNVPENLNDILIVNVKDAKNKRKIINLAGNGLFRVLGDGAVVSNITLDNSQSNTAPLVDYVGTGDLDTTDSCVIAYNIGISGELKALGNRSISGLADEVRKGFTFIVDKLSIEGGNYNISSGESKALTMSGLFNLNKGNIQLYNFNANAITFTYDGGSNPSISGIVRENGDSGEIKINGQGSSASLQIKANCKNNIESVSGVAGINSGKITGENMVIEFNEITKEGKSCTTLAGFVGLMKGGSIAGFSIQFEATDPNAYTTELFGGVVATMKGGSIGIKNDDIDLPISIGLPSAVANTFGGVIGILAKPEDEEEVPQECGIYNVQISTTTSSVEVQPIGENNNGVAYGLIVGSMNNVLANIYYECDAIDFYVINGINVGGFAGISSAEVYNFSNTAQMLGTIRGAGNVGGFIGQYTGGNSLQFNGNAWVVNEEYASVDLWIANDKTTEKNRQNFGGIFGWWNSSNQAELSATISVDGSSQTALRIENKNKVLTAEDIRNNFAYGSKPVVKNIGGVVGLSNSSIANASNSAIVGVPTGDVNINENFGFSPLVQSTIQNMVNLVSVGGIVGSISSENKDLINVINVGSVYGINSVGGIIGYASQIRDIKGEVNEIEGADTGEDEEGLILGLMNIGGVAGCIDNQSGTISGFTISSNVIGIVNVGGVVGKAEGVKIYKITVTSKKIKGNMNVGGVAGVLSNGAIGDASNNVDVGDLNTVQTLDANTVYGTIYEVIVEVVKDDQTYEKSINYLPTNIGGVVGYMLNSTSANTHSYMRVETDHLYKTKNNVEDTENSGKLTVSLNKNYIGRFNASINPDDTSLLINYPIYSTGEGQYSGEKTDCDAVDGGIGGFAGLISTTNVNAFESDVPSQTFGSVYAEYGINVGGVAGYVLTPIENTFAIKLPSLPETQDQAVNVAGSTFVGGYVGKIHSIQTDKFFAKNKLGYVNVQKYVAKDVTTGQEIEGVATGNSIGGVFGYCQHNLTGVELINSNGKSPIKIFNKASGQFGTSYVGVIVGRIDGELTDCLVDEISCGAEKVDLELNDNQITYVRPRNASKTGDYFNEIIQDYETFNYGGLVGLLNIPKGSVNTENLFTIKGTHYYPFTVDSIHSQDFESGTPVYDLKNNDNGIKTISAIAHYINLTSVQISASGLTSLYDGDKYLNREDDYKKLKDKLKGYYYTDTEKEPGNLKLFGGDCNPTNEDYKGWAKEYTMFKNWSRVIPQPSEPTGDSIQTIFNAEYITEVYASYTDNMGDMSKQWNYYSDKIVYTVYEPIGQTARLYCIYGIAELVDNVDGEYFKNRVQITNEKDACNFELNYSVGIGVESAQNVVSCTDSDKNGLSFSEVLKYLAECRKNSENLNDLDGLIKQCLYNKYEKWYTKDAKVNGFIYVKDWDYWTEYPEAYADAYIREGGYCWNSGVNGRIGRDAFRKHVEPITLVGENKNAIKENGYIEDEHIDTAKTNSARYGYTYGYTYYHSSQYKGKEKGAYFIFTTVYGWSPYTTEGGKKIEEDATTYSNSGSLFEVSGTPLTLATEMLKKGGFDFGRLFWIVLTVVAVGGLTYAALHFGWVVGIIKLLKTGTMLMKALAVVSVSLAAGIVINSANEIWTNIALISQGLEDIEDSYVKIEEMSMGYLGSVYSKDVYWEDGVFMSGNDGMYSFDVKAIVTETGPKNESIFDVAESYYESVVKSLTEKDSFEVGDTITLPITYFCSQNSNIIPTNIDEYCEVVIADEDNSDNAKVFKYLGIKSYKVPKYKKVDNEIYICTLGAKEYKNELYKNYGDASNNFTPFKNLGLNPDEGRAVNYGGYMYVDDSDAEGVLPASEADYLKQTYGIDRKIIKEQTYKIAKEKISGDVGNYKKKIKDDYPVTWVVGTGEISETVEFGYVGNKKPTDKVYVSNSAWFDKTTGSLQYYKYNGAWYDINGNPVDINTITKDNLMFDTAYFSCSSTGKPIIEVTLIPQWSTTGFTFEQCGINRDEYCLVYDVNGNITLSVPYYYYNQSTKTGTKSGGDGKAYQLNEVTEGLDTELNIYNPLNWVTDNDKRVFNNGSKVSLEEIRDKWVKNPYYYKNWSISAEYYNPLYSVFEVIDGKLYAKSLIFNMQIVEHNGYTYVVKQVVRNYSNDGINYYNYNKYVYSYDMDGVNAKLYTRYKYEENVFKEDVTDEEGNITTINGLKQLMPLENGQTVLKDIVFAEGVRVSLFAGNAKIYKMYNLDTGEKITTNSKSGIIKCLLP